MNNYSGILLESGTGELEVLEFVISEKHYVINVVKTKEILQVGNVTKIPNSNPAIAGLALIRDSIITLVDLKYALENEKQSNIKECMTLICEFNNTKVAFLVDRVLGIHRIGWDEIRKPDAIVENSQVIGNIVMNNKLLMLLDFEKIVMDIMSSYGVYEDKIENIQYKKNRADVKLVLADDSNIIRTMLKDVLTAAGYTNLIFFDDGQQAFEYLMNLKEKNGEKFLEYVDMLITDIEMPQLDGHTLTRRIKEDNLLKQLPVIIFSSLITDDLYHKGEAVGADAQMSKPQIDELVGIIDNIFNKNI
jgi:two-component system chemotaxis response regulator CheV